MLIMIGKVNMGVVSLEFKYICEIVPEKKNNDSIIEFLPQSNY